MSRIIKAVWPYIRQFPLVLLSTTLSTYLWVAPFLFYVSPWYSRIAIVVTWLLMYYTTAKDSMRAWEHIKCEARWDLAEIEQRVAERKR